MLKLYLLLFCDLTLTLNPVHLLQWNIAISREWKDHTELVDAFYDANKNSTMSVQIIISFHFVFAFLLLPQVT